jgi:hypothetical protein
LGRKNDSLFGDAAFEAFEHYHAFMLLGGFEKQVPKSFAPFGHGPKENSEKKDDCDRRANPFRHVFNLRPVTPKRQSFGVQIMVIPKSPKKFSLFPLDVKTVLLLFAFFGVGSVGAAIRYARAVAGWLAAPAIEAAQKQGLDHLDATLNQFEARQARRDSVFSRKVDGVREILGEIPAAREAAKRIKQREQHQLETYGQAVATAKKGEVQL